jgi:glycosyltransferase involved in cell wall biosynthesis
VRFCLVGTGRSGTTLLRDLLNSHEDVFVFDETHWWPKMWEVYGLGPAPIAELAKIVERTRYVDGKPTLDVPLADLLADEFPEGGSVTIRQFAEVLGSGLAAREGKQWWADKTPDYGPYMGMLQTIWPECGFIHIVRNGRDTALSMAHHPGFQWMVGAGEPWWIWPSFNSYGTVHEQAGAPLVEFLRLWERRLLRIRDEASRLREGSSLEVQFEELCTDPSTVLARITEFVRLPVSGPWLESAARAVDSRRVGNRDWPEGLEIPADLAEFLSRNDYAGDGGRTAPMPPEPDAAEARARSGPVVLPDGPVRRRPTVPARMSRKRPNRHGRSARSLIKKARRNAAVGVTPRGRRRRLKGWLFRILRPLTSQQRRFNNAIAASVAAVDSEARARHRHLQARAARTTGRLGEAEEAIANAPRRPSRSGSSTRHLALVSPVPPQASGIADYSWRLAHALARRIDVDLVGPDQGGEARQSDDLAVIGIDQFTARDDVVPYSEVVYAMGNSSFHRFVFDQMIRRPGVLWAHEARFTSFMRAYGESRGLGSDWLASLVRAEYPDIPRAVTAGGLRPDLAAAHDIYLMGPLIDHARRVITTSDLTAEVARRERPDRAADIACIGFGYPCRPRREHQPGPVFRLGTVGRQAEEKGVGLLIDAFALLRDRVPAVELVIAGELSPDLRRRLEERARRLDLGGSIRLAGWLSAEEYDATISGLDLALQLRISTNGEVSGVVADLLGTGVPTVVSAIGPMAQLPDGAVHKVAPDIDPGRLAGDVVALIADDDRRLALGLAGHRHACAHDFDWAAERLLQSLF